MVEGRIRLWVINEQDVDGLWKICVDKKGRKSARRNMREVLSDGVPFSPLVPPGTLEAIVNTTADSFGLGNQPGAALSDTGMAVQNSNVEYAFVRFILSED
ncbi:hypothetical protein QQP08_004956 [Theobroma cacao]|nr:hypothetical protein QQP08_004956 [Theobroma cacao]